MTATATPAPPLLGFARAVHTALDRASGCDPLWLSATQKIEALSLLEAAQQRIGALKLTVLGAARTGDDICEDGAYRDAADLLSGRLRQDRAKWSREQKLAEALEERWNLTRTACLDGSISLEHAAVIVRVLDELHDLPEVYAEHLDAETLARAERHLIDLATEHNPRALKQLAAHLFEVIAPEAADEIEARKLAAMEQRAEAAMGITIRRDAKGIEGLKEIKLLVPDAIADRFSTHLHAFTNPRLSAGGLGTDSPGGSSADPEEGAERASRRATNGGPLIPFAHPDGQKIPQSRRLAMAFAQLLETLDPHRLPIHGGDATNVIITIGLEELRKGLAAGTHGLGEDASRMSAAQVRRLACTAHLIPAVLGGDSEILDLGRSQRLFNRAQRKAMALRDQQCRAEGCTIPAPWCEGHHLNPWSKGGKTDLNDGKLLCSWHHHRAHDDRYLTQQLPNGDLRFSRRT